MRNNLQAEFLQKYIISQAIEFSDFKSLKNDSWLKIEDKLNFFIVKNGFKIAKGKLKNKNEFIFCDFKKIEQKEVEFKKNKIYIKIEKPINAYASILDINGINAIICTDKPIASAKMFIKDNIYLNIKEML